MLEHLFMLPTADLFDPNTISNLIEAGGYVVLFLLLFVAGLGFPMPEDIPLLCAGFLISQHKMHWVPAAIVAWLGIMGGDCILYNLGRRFGLNITRMRWVGKHLTHERILKAERWFARHGIWVVAVGRMIAGVRGAMVVAAGATRFSYLKFVLADGIAAIVSGGLFLVLGWWLGKTLGSVEAIHKLLRGYEDWIFAGLLVILILAAVIFMLIRAAGKRRVIPFRIAHPLARREGFSYNTPMPEPIIRIEHLSHSYGQNQALKDLNLRIDAGEIFGFLGPNGSGKTTLFRILSTLVPPQTGRVTMLGFDLAGDRDEIRKHIGVVFQYPSLDKQLTAEENLRHHGHLYGLSGQVLQERMNHMLDRVNLADRRSERVGTFSGGMRRRVELAKGLLNRPRILLLDESSTGLDPGARIDLWQFLHDIQRDDGTTILVTTHLMDEAEHCSRLAIMEQGNMLACDSPDTLKRSIGGDVITLSTPHPDQLKVAINGRFKIEAEQFENTLRIERPRGHQFIPELIEAFPGEIESVSLGKPTLEDVFICVTGHKLRQDAA